MKVISVNQDPGIAPGREKGAAIHVAALRDALRGLGADVLCVDEPDEVRVVSALEAALVQDRCDLLYERYALGRTAACLFARERGIPYALEVNAPLLEEATRFRGHEPSSEEIEAEELLFRSADCVFVVSAPLEAYARERGATCVEICPNGVDTDLFRPRASDTLRDELVPRGRLAVGFHGRLRPWHGLDLLAEAVAIALDANLPVHLLTAGRGDFGAAFSGRVPESNRTHVDWLPQADVAQYVACFDVLALAYLSGGPLYFSPLKLAEGMACGAVPVAPRGGDWCRNLVDGENSLLYRLGDAQDLARVIGVLALQPQMRADLGRGAREVALELSWRNVGKRVLAFAAARGVAE